MKLFRWNIERQAGRPVVRGRASRLVGFVLMSLVACKPRSGMETIECQGQRIKLSRSYPSYEAYQSDPNNIDPSERRGFVSS